jgi:hypothetical protein
VWTEWNSVVFDFDPGSNRDFGVSDGNIMFAHSGDGGATWDSAVRVNDDTGTNDQFFPAMAAGPGNQVHVTWNDRRNDPSNISYEVFYASLNGKSFSGNTPVTTASSNPTGTNFIGDYNDLDQAGGAQNVHAVWTDRRNVTSPVGSRGNDVFTARKRGP